MVLWALFSLVGAAILTPWIYSAGKALAAHVIEAQQNGVELSGFIESLGGSCDRAKIGRYFSRAWMFSALVGLPFLIRRVRKIGQANNAGKIMDLDKLGAKQSVLHLISGFIIAGGILWAVGMILAEAGAFAMKPNPDTSKLIGKCVMPAIIASLLEEWLFRGLVLGLWMRTSGAVKATIYSSLLFAFLHFLKPPGGVSDPTHALAGFELVGKILLQFTQPQFFVTDFLTLTLIGILLCWATLRTRSLWMAIGLHGGLVFAYLTFKLFYRATKSPLHPWGVGDTLKSGVIPLLALLAMGVVSHFVIRQLMCPCRKKKREESQSA